MIWEGLALATSAYLLDIHRIAHIVRNSNISLTVFKLFDCYHDKIKFGSAWLLRIYMDDQC